MVLSILIDGLDAMASRRHVKVQSERYYYTSNKLFEQSLDIYRPSAATGGAKKTNISNNDESSPNTCSPPIVALVVGSAWLGHRSFIYSQTSWWNSSGPRAVAELGYFCVCIRHRGSFMKSLSILTMLFVAIMAAFLVACIKSMMDEDAWVMLEDTFGERMSLGQAGAFIMVFITGMVLIEMAGVGAASYEDMMNDVMDALQWLNANENRLGLGPIPSRTLAQKEVHKDDVKSTRRQFVFGGYSSGGHVAASVTQRPQLWKDRNLPPPHVHCDCVLYISPVLSTRSYIEILSKKMPSLSSSASVPSLSPSEESMSEHLLRQTSSISEISSSSPKPPPTWLTDGVVKAVFGHDVAATIPSPIHTYDMTPPIPHIFLGCEKEMFGLNWLDTFFCSPSYCELLMSLGIKSRYTAVQSDHWNILNSIQLSEVLGKELDWIELECSKKR